MKLFPILVAVAAVTAQLCTAVPVRAESHWLVLVIGNGYDDGAMSVIPMGSSEQCEEQAAVWMTSDRVTRSSDPSIGFECLEGK